MEEQKPTLPSPPDLEGTLEETIEKLKELSASAGMSAKALRNLANAWDMASLQCRRIASRLSARAKELRYEAEKLLLERLGAGPSGPEESDEG